MTNVKFQEYNVDKTRILFVIYLINNDKCIIINANSTYRSLYYIGIYTYGNRRLRLLQTTLDCDYTYGNRTNNCSNYTYLYRFD